MGDGMKSALVGDLSDFVSEPSDAPLSGDGSSSKNVSGQFPGDHLSTLAYTGYLILAVLTQSVQGIYPGIMRYLQVTSGLDGLMIVCGTALLNVVVMLPFMTHYFGCKAMFRIQWPLVYGLIVMGSNVTSIFATRLVFSVYVQLILLGTPFVVAILCKLVLKQTLPRFTIPAMIFAVLGAVVALFGDILSNASSDLTLENWVGLLLAVLATWFLGAYFVFVTTQGANISNEVLVFLTFVFNSFLTPLSLAIEDWTLWLELGFRDWALFLVFTLIIFLGAQLMQVYTIRMIGAPMVSVMLPLRLVAALVFGASPLLNEPLGLLNLVGSSVVFVTLLLYLYAQYYLKKEQTRRIIQPEVDFDNIKWTSS